MAKIPGYKAVEGPALLWKRAMAFLIDILVINLIIMYPFRSLIKSLVPSESMTETYAFLISNTQVATQLYVVIGTVTALSILYFAFFEALTTQTVGKMLMNIYVKSELKKLSFWQALVRRLFMIPVIPFVLLWVIDPLYMFFSKNNRRLSETFAKTHVAGIYYVYR